MLSNKYFICDNVTRAFEEAYNAVNRYGEEVDSRIGKTRHITDVTIVVEDPYHNVCLNAKRNMSLKYMLGEIEWYMSGSNRVKDIAKYAKMWNDLTDDGETVNSAYGYRIFHKFGFDQLQYCIDKLKANPYDRQAVIHIKEADNKPTKDTPCTCLLQFTYEEGKLNLHTYMRSNDIWLGLPYDMAFFTVLLQKACTATGLPVGRYYHTVGDLHLYEKHWDRLVGKTDELELDCSGWDYCLETFPSIAKILIGDVPDNLMLRRLWRLNHENERQH